jgi:hypothetical protein
MLWSICVIGGVYGGEQWLEACGGGGDDEEDDGDSKRRKVHITRRS